jgi:limonene-1,2-epoxide hydrolase
MNVTPGVQRSSVVTGATPDAVRVDRFFYPPGGHTHWHVHTGEQVLYGESGRGWVQFDGAERDHLDPGAVVHVAVGRRHWHGATPDHELVHLAVTAGGDTVWLGEVTAAEYLGSAVGTAPMPVGPGDVVDAFIAAIERHDIDAAVGLLTDDVVYDNVPIGPVTGPAAVREALAGPIGRAERVEWVVRHQVAQGQVVMNERVDRFRVDGRWIELPVAGIFELRDGRIAAWRDYFDLASYRSQT